MKLISSHVLKQSMLKRGATRGGKRLSKMKEYSLVTLTPPGLREIKQVELYEK
jgi:hypothetical protein